MSTIATEMGPKASMLELEGLRLLPTSPGFAAAVARAYGRQRRPRCLCRPEGIEMYIARLAGNYLVKRMPGTGALHAPDCPSFEPSAEQSGLHPLLGHAIREDPATGKTSLRLGFSMSDRPGRARPEGLASMAGSASSNRTRLSLRALLHFLWDQAELTRWHPGFEGRRGWGVVRRQLLSATSQMVACGDSLSSRLEIPEPFLAAHQDAINARLRARCAAGASRSGARPCKRLLIAEVKEIAPARHGYKAVIKHLPDLVFVLEDGLYLRLERLFEQELALWSASDDIRLMMIATFRIGPEGLPRVAELSLMCVTGQWLPIETMADYHLVIRLARERRSFTRLLRYDLRREVRMPTLILTDRGDPAQEVFADDG